MNIIDRIRKTVVATTNAVRAFRGELREQGEEIVEIRERLLPDPPPEYAARQYLPPDDDEDCEIGRDYSFVIFDADRDPRRQRAENMNPFIRSMREDQ